MPAYDYRCDTCGTAHEQRHPMSGDPGPCPTCRATRLTKVFRPPALQFTGSGFHVTDYR